MQLTYSTEYARAGYRVSVRHFVDESPDLSWLEGDRCETDEERAADAARLASYGEDWHMVGIVVKAWRDGQETENSLWGIESDSGADYLREVERELFDECRAELGDTIARRAGYAAAGVLQ